MPNHQNPWFQPGSAGIRGRGYLPHWTAEPGCYFVTFRLADSLPRKVLDAYLMEREEIIREAASMNRDLTAEEIARLDHLYGERVERFLDSGAGSCRLSDPRIAELVKGALQFFDGQRYMLVAWCIMPNHVHVVFTVAPNHGLSDILHSWKSFTAHRATRLLGLTGEFWQREYYDRLIRDEEEYAAIVNYVLENPVRAGLTDWPWVGRGIPLQDTAR
jgi:REP element-mobilizing transposase RayT